MFNNGTIPGVIFNSTTGNYEARNQTYSNMTLSQVTFFRNDTGPALIFIDCQFQQTVIQQCQFIGVSFKNCEFEDCHFNDNQIALAGNPSSNELETTWSFHNSEFNNTRIIGQGKIYFDITFTNAVNLHFNNCTLGQENQNQVWKFDNKGHINLIGSTLTSVEMQNIMLDLAQSSHFQDFTLTDSNLRFIHDCDFTNANFFGVAPADLAVNNIISTSRFLASEFHDCDFSNIYFDQLSMSYVTFDVCNSDFACSEWSNSTLNNVDFRNCNLKMQNFNDVNCFILKVDSSYMDFGNSNNAHFKNSYFTNSAIQRNSNSGLTTKFTSCVFEGAPDGSASVSVAGFTNSSFTDCWINAPADFSALDYSTFTRLSTEGSHGAGYYSNPNFAVNNVFLIDSDINGLEFTMINGVITGGSIADADTTLTNVAVTNVTFRSGFVTPTICNFTGVTFQGGGMQMQQGMLTNSNVKNSGYFHLSNAVMNNLFIQDSHDVSFTNNVMNNLASNRAGITITDSQIENFFVQASALSLFRSQINKMNVSVSLALSGISSNFSEVRFDKLTQFILGNMESMDLTKLPKLNSATKLQLTGTLNQTNLSGMQLANLIVNITNPGVPLVVTRSNLSDTNFSNLIILRDEFSTECSWIFDSNNDVNRLNFSGADVRGLCRNTRFGFFGCCNSTQQEFNRSNIITNENTQMRPFGCDLIWIGIVAGIAGAMFLAFIANAIYVLHKLHLARQKPDPILTQERMPNLLELTADLESSSSTASISQ